MIKKNDLDELIITRIVNDEVCEFVIDEVEVDELKDVVLKEIAMLLLEEELEATNPAALQFLMLEEDLLDEKIESLTNVMLDFLYNNKQFLTKLALGELPNGREIDEAIMSMEDDDY